MLPEILKRIVELERRQANLLRIGTVAEVDHDRALVRVIFGDPQMKNAHLKTAWLPWFTHRAGGNARTWAAPAIGEQVMVLAPSGELVNGVALPAIYQTAHAAPADTAEIEKTIYPDGTTLAYDYKKHLLSADVKGDVELTTTGYVKAEIKETLAAKVHGAVQIIALDTVTATITRDLTATVLAGNATLTATTGNISATAVAGNVNITATAGNVALTAGTAIALTAPQIMLNGAITQGASAGGTTATFIGPMTVTDDVTAAGISVSKHKHGGVETGGGTTGAPTG